MNTRTKIKELFYTIVEYLRTGDPATFAAWHEITATDVATEATWTAEIVMTNDHPAAKLIGRLAYLRDDRAIATVLYPVMVPDYLALRLPDGTVTVKHHTQLDFDLAHVDHLAGAFFQAFPRESLS